LSASPSSVTRPGGAATSSDSAASRSLAPGSTRMPKPGSSIRAATMSISAAGVSTNADNRPEAAPSPLSRSSISSSATPSSAPISSTTPAARRSSRSSAADKGPLATTRPPARAMASARASRRCGSSPNSKTPGECSQT